MHLCVMCIVPVMVWALDPDWADLSPYIEARLHRVFIFSMVLPNPSLFRANRDQTRPFVSQTFGGLHKAVRPFLPWVLQRPPSLRLSGFL